mgnify:CR=1 FL=1
MKMIQANAFPCLLALIPSLASAQVARIALPVAPLSAVSGAFASAPRLLTAPSALGASLLPLAAARPILSALPAPTPIAAKPALAALKSDASRFAQAELPTNAGATVDQVSAAMFDGAADFIVVPAHDGERYPTPPAVF